MAVRLFLSFFLLCLCSNSKYCPSEEWVPCVQDTNSYNGNGCLIPPEINKTTVSYGGFNGNENEGQWVFAQITNTANDELKIQCHWNVFGEIYPSNSVTGCCYLSDEKDSYIDSQGPSTNEDNWKQIASYNQHFKTDFAYIRFGAAYKDGHQFIYRYLKGSGNNFQCTPEWFGWLPNIANSAYKCYVNVNANITEPSFIACGNSQTDLCNLDVLGNSGSEASIRLVRYGYEPDFSYRYIYGNNYWNGGNDQVPCSDRLFDNPNPSASTKYCYVSNSTAMTGAIGKWTVAESCAGSNCVINTQINIGTTSTNSQATTKSWTNTVSLTVSAGLTFEGIGEASDELTTSTSTTVSNTISSSYSVQLTKECGVECGNGTSADWTVYQWILNMGEYEGTNISPFDIYACNFVCSIQPTPPKCPPGFCKPNTDCQQCEPY